MKRSLFAPLKCVLLSLFFFGGCCYQKPLNLSDAKKQVERYYECGHYENDLEKIVKRARNYFEKILPTDRMVVVFDIDDTVLSDYSKEKCISFGYIPKLSHEWVLQADAPAIGQVKKLYDYLVKRGFQIIFLTGRKYNEYEATLKNLRDQGYTTFNRLIVRQKDEHAKTALAYKSAQRKALNDEGFTIIASIGDQWSDLRGGYAGHTIKLPNFRYKIP